MPHKTNQPNIFEPQHAEHFDLINTTLKLTDDEYNMLMQNRFVVSDRLTFNQFKRAYAWIYWKDLPVLVTTDAILHSIHQTYDEILKQVEMTILTEKLIALLSGALEFLKANRKLADTTHQIELHKNLELYLALPLTILSSADLWRFTMNPDHVPEDTAETMGQWLEQIGAANFEGLRLSWDENGKPVERKTVVGIERVTFFGLPRELDFTQFRARGHYDEPWDLVRYFCAMMWLQLLDFRIVEFDTIGQATLHRNQLAGAFLLLECIEKSGQKQTWEEINDLLSAFVGWSDNVTLNGLQLFFVDAGITHVDECYSKPEAELLKLFAENDYGRQRIRGHYQQRYRNLKGELQHNISFALMGQRYTIESDIMQQLVYDKLIVNGKRMQRPYPSPFDVLYTLGNDRALAHLHEDLEQYGYNANLNQIRDWVSTHSSEFWENSFYNHWLNAIRALNMSTIGDTYPIAMRSSAWADKTLQTQLGSWTELRHDNILYVKPPFTVAAVCDYPAGYVEPYPALYSGLRKYAEFGYQVFERISFPVFEESYEEAKARLDENWNWHDDEIRYRPQKAASIQRQALTYFKKLAEIMTQLEALSQKELTGTPFSDEDNLFLRSIVVRKYISDERYGGVTEEHWDGWYTDLLPFGDQPPQLVADVHTNYNAAIGEVGVLHIGLDSPALMLFAAEDSKMNNLFVGPVYTVHEHLEKSSPPYRMTDEDWSRYLYHQSSPSYLKGETELSKWRLQRLEQANNPDTAEIARLRAELRQKEDRLANFTQVSTPNWTKSIRVRHNEPEGLDLPPAYADFKECLSQSLQDKLDAIYDSLLETSRNGLHWSGDYGIGRLAEIASQEPEKLMNAEGMTQEFYDELLMMLRVKGHIQ